MNEMFLKRKVKIVSKEKGKDIKTTLNLLAGSG